MIVAAERGGMLKPGRMIADRSASSHAQLVGWLPHELVTTKLDLPRSCPYLTFDRGPKAGQTYQR
jgi:hypothetical protein